MTARPGQYLAEPGCLRAPDGLRAPGWRDHHGKGAVRLEMEELRARIAALEAKA